MTKKLSVAKQAGPVSASIGRHCCIASTTSTLCVANVAADSSSREYFGSGSKHSLMVVSDQVDTSAANGRAFANLVMTLSEWERETIAERTKAAMAHKKALGEYCGGPVPYGYRLSRNRKKLIEAPKEQAVLARVRELAASGLSIGGIVTRLRGEGVRSRSGAAFRRSQVTRMLTRMAEAHIGL